MTEALKPWSIPSSWIWSNVAAIVESSFYGPRFAKNQYVASGIPTIRTTDMTQSGDIVLRGPPEVQVSPAELARFGLIDGDLLVTRTGSIGRCAVYHESIGPALPSAYLIRFRLQRNLCEPEYLVRYLLGPFGQNSLGASATAVTQPNVNAQAIGTVELAIPPLNEQRRIVAKLEALQARSRRARETIDAIPPLLEKLRQSILAAAFRGDLTKDWRAKHTDVEPATELLKRIRTERRKKWEETELAKLKAKGKSPTDDKWKAKYKEPAPVDATELPELPDGWCWASAEDLCHDITVGHVGPMEHRYVAAGVPFLRSQNVRANRYDPSGLRYIPADFHAELIKSKLAPGDLVVVRSGAPGTACVIPNELTEANCADLVVARLVPLVDPHVMAFYMNSSWASGAVLDAQVGVAQQHFNVGAMRTLHMPLMPRPEQEVLRERITTALGALSTSMVRMGELTGLLSNLERTTLAKAFRGELVPQDPNDESAEAMLARVRGQNGAGAANGATDGSASRQKPKKGKVTRAQARS